MKPFPTIAVTTLLFGSTNSITLPVAALLLGATAILQPVAAQADAAQEEFNKRTFFAMSFKAALDGDDVVVKGGLQLGVDVNGSDDKKVTLLMAAASKGHLKVVQLLLEKGADASLKDAAGFTTAAYAKLGANAEVIALIEAAAAKTAEDAPAEPAPAQTAADDETLWTQLDGNQSGWLSGNELKGGWVKYDADADGEVTKAEFMAGRAAEAPAGKVAPATEAAGAADQTLEAALFEQLDTSGEGFLDGGELNYGNVKSYDSNADGRVSLQEFTAGRAKDRLAKGGKGGAAAPRPAVTTPRLPQPTTLPATQTAPATQTPLRLSSLPRKPGFIVGRAVFADGRPLPEFDISAAGFDGQSVNNVNGGTHVIGFTTGRNGSYSLQTMDSFSHTKPVNALVTAVTAKTKISYHGQTYMMDLHPLDGTNFLPDAQGKGLWSTEGLSRDFVLKISGLKAGKDDTDGPYRAFSYHGATLNFSDNDGGNGFKLPQATVRPKFPRKAQLVVTLTPQGPLLDGSTGQTLTRQFDVGSLGEYPGHAFDIPIGVYSVQAQVINGGAATPLAVRVGDGTWANAVAVAFAASANGGADNQTLEIKL